MRIAILGWGSLLRGGGPEFDEWHEPWEYDGPTLKIEFSRVSKRRLCALTLVIDEDHGSPTTVAWCLSRRTNVDDAARDLRCREGTTLEHIDRLVVAAPPQPSAQSALEGLILAWACLKNLDAVIWTALKSNFEAKANQLFSVAAAISYVRDLPPAGKMKQAEYLRLVPHFVRTPVRSALERELENPAFEVQSPRCWAGVDVGGHRKGFHVAVVDGQRLLHLERVAEPGALVALLLKWGPCVVSVDSPRRPAPDGQPSREGELRLNKDVCRLFFTPDQHRLEGNPFYEWIRRGFQLYAALDRNCFVVIECFPTASFTRWAGRRGNTRRPRWTQEALNRLGLGNLPPRLNQDERDAIAAAMTAYAYERCQTEHFGEIVVPRVEDSTGR